MSATLCAEFLNECEMAEAYRLRALRLIAFSSDVRAMIESAEARLRYSIQSRQARVARRAS